LLLRVDEKTICSVPPQWTDLDAVDPAVTLSNGRAPFLLADLMELDRLISRLRECIPGADDGASM